MIEELKDKKILLICESPNKTKHLQEYIKKAGYKDTTVLASYGHIAEIKNGGPCYNTGIYPDKDFEMDLAVADDKKDVVTRLKAAADKADIVFIGSDGDNEGAQIAWSLVKFLKLPIKKCRRFITHEITPKAVVKALENPVPFDTNNAMAAQARMCLDKLIGYSLSPVARTYVGAKSVGRCQSAGLKLIVDREKEIENFKPETYFDLYLNFEKNKTKFRAKFVGTDKFPIEHLKTKQEVDNVIAGCKGDYIVKNIIKKEKQESPKPPFCTATFQQEANSKLGLSTKDIMSVAQKLFESGAITYMRTDDTTISPEFIGVLKPYIESNYGKKSYCAPRIGKKQEGAQEGHECLRVTDPSLTPEKFLATNGNQLHAKIYKLIWQRTIAACLPNAIISETTYNIYNDIYKFNLISNEVCSEGYRAVYSYKDDDAADEVLVKETFVVGEILKKALLEDKRKETMPPARFKEATFLKELQKQGIGRPSTYATIVETVLSESRGYCKLENKLMIPTQKGMQLSEYLDRNFSNLINIGYTRDMEKELDNIADGKIDKLQFLQNFYKNLQESLAKNTNDGNGSLNAPPKICPSCGKTLIVRRSKYGKLFYGCDYPKCKYTEAIK